MTQEPRSTFAADLRERPHLIGVIHLPPLPGAARPGPGIDNLLAVCERDARAYAEGGMGALLIENYGDAPFGRGRVEPHVLTLMTRIGLAVRAVCDLPLGVNVLRSDGIGALAVAAACDAAFVRMNVLAGVVATDQGLIEGEAAAVQRYRQRLGGDVSVLADVDVKHGTQLWGDSLAGRAADLVERAFADALIVTGPATGAATERADIDVVRDAVPGTPVLIGSGVTADNAAGLLAGTQGAIVGTSVKTDGRTASSVDRRRVEELVAVSRGVWGDQGR